MLDESDLCDLTMQGRDVTAMHGAMIEPSTDLERLISHLEDPGLLLTWSFPEASDISVSEFDRKKQSIWFMPQQYLDMDIA